MKVLFIDGDDDYHFLIFEQQDEFSIDEIVKTCENKENKEHRFETIDGDHFDAKLHEFDDVDEKFIQFIRSKQDYDDAKHSNWIVVD